MTKKAFTLIELLIVFAVIGLLAGIILASVKSVRERANINKTLQYSKSLDNLLAADAVGIWNFDDQTNPTKDTSGWANHGTINGATFTTDTPHKAAGAGAGKYALSFDGNDYVDVGTGPSLKVDDKSFTLAAWIKPAANIPTDSRFAVMAVFSPGWLMDLPDNGGIEGYRFYTGSGDCIYNPPGNLISLEWTHFVVTRDLAVNQVKIYLNGELKKTFTVTSVTASTNPLLIGKRTDGYFFNGTIDEVRIFNRALPQTEIQKLYAEGLKTHSNLVSK